MSVHARTMALFPGEPGPTVVRAERPRGLVHIGLLARQTGTNPRTLKRRLRLLDASLGGRLLVRLTEGGHHYVRFDMLRQALPELVTPQLAAEVLASADGGDLAQASSIASELQQLRESVAELTEEVRHLRDVVVMSSDASWTRES